MLAAYLSTILVRDLRGLRREVEAYPDDASVWRTVPTIPNAAGTLVLHLAGNLQHFIGGTLGKTGYIRDRDAEFSRRHVPRTELLAQIDDSINAVQATMAQLTNADMAATFPIAFGDVRFTTADFLLHLATHLAYHLGQVDYHRRGIAEDGRSVGTVSPLEMHSAVKG